MCNLRYVAYCCCILREMGIDWTKLSKVLDTGMKYEKSYLDTLLEDIGINDLRIWHEYIR